MLNKDELHDLDILLNNNILNNDDFIVQLIACTNAAI